MTTDKDALLIELDELEESAKLLGRTEVKKEFGCYTQGDFRFALAMRQSISKHRARIAAALAGQDAKINAEGRVCPNTLKPCACTRYSPGTSDLVLECLAIPSAPALQAERERAEKAEAELAALKEALRNPTDEVIDAPRSFLLGLDAGCMTSAKMREHLRLSGVDFSMLPEWFQTGDAHLTKAGRAICILAFMTAHLLKD